MDISRALYWHYVVVPVDVPADGCNCVLEGAMTERTLQLVNIETSEKSFKAHFSAKNEHTIFRSLAKFGLSRVCSKRTERGGKLPGLFFQKPVSRVK